MSTNISFTHDERGRAISYVDFEKDPEDKVGTAIQIPGWSGPNRYLYDIVRDLQKLRGDYVAFGVEAPKAVTEAWEVYGTVGNADRIGNDLPDVATL